MKEIWKPVKGFEGYYEVSSLARIKRLERVFIDSRGRKQHLREYIYKIKNNNENEYTQVYLSINGKGKYIRLHRIVAEAFIPNPENKETVNHKDGKKNNNLPENLEWATYSENNLHAYKTGLRDKDKCGKNNGWSTAKRKCYVKDEYDNIIYESDSISGITDWLGISHQKVYNILNRDGRYKNYKIEREGA